MNREYRVLPEVADDVFGIWRFIAEEKFAIPFCAVCRLQRGVGQLSQFWNFPRVHATALGTG